MRRKRLFATLALLAWVMAGAMVPGVGAAASRASTREPQQQSGGAAATNPAYLAGMPSVEKVKQMIQGSDPTDSLARQVAVLNILQEVIQRMEIAPGRRYGSQTADELKYFNMYRLGAYQLTQDYAKAHTAAETKAFNQLHGRYELDMTLRREMFQKVFTDAFLADYSKVDAGINADYKAHIEQERKQAEQAQRHAGTPGERTISPMAKNDPTSMAARRCLELGGSEADCITKGIGSGLLALLGIDLDETRKALGTRGLRMGGGYRADNGIGISFGQDTVDVAGCGKLVPDPRGYNVAWQANQWVVQVLNDPGPLAFVLTSSGQLVGPGTVDVGGRVITGYQVYDVQKRYSDGNIVPGSVHQEQVPVYAQRTERCVLPTFHPIAVTDAEVSPVSLLAALLGGEKSKEIKQDEARPTPAGLRVAGVYSAPGGLKMEFHPVAVILDCGQAHVMRQYAVQAAGGQVSIAVANGNSPFALTLRLDGNLGGAGTVEVSGRLMVGMRGNEFVFEPVTARCALSTLRAN